MKNKDLIEKLKQYPEDMEVLPSWETITRDFYHFKVCQDKFGQQALLIDVDGDDETFWERD